MVRFTLGREERLTSRKSIESLFEEGQSLVCYPIRLIWREESPAKKFPYPIEVMFAVGKKKFSRAVDRNRLKRLMRESYRKNKPGLYEVMPPSRHFHLAFQYTGTSILELKDIQKGMAQALERWLKKINQEN